MTKLGDSLNCKMVVNAPEAPVQAEVIFVIEATAVNSAYINEMKTNYIIPSLEYFHGGSLDEGGGNGSTYSIVAYKQADCHPGFPVETYGPFNTPQEVLETIDAIEYVGGHCEGRACVAEALSVVLACYEDLRPELVHVLLVCCSPPYSAYGGGMVPPGAPATVEGAARMVCERGAQLSVLCARRVAALGALYELAGGELHAAQQRNYAKDPRHMILLRGFSLKERPPSPAPPPAPEIQADVYPQGRGVPSAGRGAPGFRGAGAGPAAASCAGAARASWLAPPPRQPLYANNSALLTQLAQPSYPPPAAQRLPSMLAGGSGVGGAGGVGGAAGPGGGLQRTYIWSGVLEWMEKGKTPGEQKVTKLLPCQVSANSKDVEPELKVETWPSKLLMQLMPKQLISNIGGQYLKDSKSVLFHLQPNEALDALTKVMVNGFAGCVHFSSPPQCDIKVLILLYTPDKKAYLGFIPNNQATFVDRLRKVIQQQKITQIINKQMPGGAPGTMPPTMPPNTMTGSAGMSNPGIASGSMGAPSGMGGSGMGQVGQVGQMGQMQPGQPGPSSSMGQPQVQQHPQGMMMGGQVGMGGQVSKGGQLGGLEAARQQNLEKIQHLQQTLEAAHQQEAQFKSQMDIMSHLHAAQQQELTYKQMEEQQRKHQLQQQLQQQLRGAGGVGGPGGVGGVPSHAPRIMRPMMPQNPGLRHLLQQAPGSQNYKFTSAIRRTLRSLPA